VPQRDPIAAKVGIVALTAAGLLGGANALAVSVGTGFSSVALSSLRFAALEIFPHRGRQSLLTRGASLVLIDLGHRLN
jgi:hypothetical protein